MKSKLAFGFSIGAIIALLFAVSYPSDAHAEKDVGYHYILGSEYHPNVFGADFSFVALVPEIITVDFRSSYYVADKIGRPVRIYDLVTHPRSSKRLFGYSMAYSC